MAGIEIITEIHHQRPHNGIVITINSGCKCIDIRHKFVAKPVGCDYCLICRMSFRGDVPRFPGRILSVGTVQRTEYSPLVPTSLKFPPLFEVVILYTSAIEEPLGIGITVLNTETAYILSPERNAGN